MPVSRSGSNGHIRKASSSTNIAASEKSGIGKINLTPGSHFNASLAWKSTHA